MNIEVPEYWADCTFECFCDSMYMLGVDVDPQKDVRYSGFWSQGDGASFKGVVNFSNCNANAFIQCFPTDQVMIELAKRWESVAGQLQEVELRLDFNCYRYCHENTMLIDQWYAEDSQWVKMENLKDEVITILRGFAKQLYKQLKAEYDFQLADQTAYRYAELEAEVKTLREKILELDSIPHTPPELVADHLEELQASRHELVEILTSQMSQLEDQFHYWKDGKSMSIHEFLTQYGEYIS